jgi:hypothetical protein
MSEYHHICYVANCQKPAKSRGMGGVYCDDHWKMRRGDGKDQQIAALKARCEALTEVVAALAKFDGRNNISHLREMARQALADGGGQ